MIEPFVAICEKVFQHFWFMLILSDLLRWTSVLKYTNLKYILYGFYSVAVQQNRSKIYHWRIRTKQNQNPRMICDWNIFLLLLAKMNCALKKWEMWKMKLNGNLWIGCWLFKRPTHSIIFHIHKSQTTWLLFTKMCGEREKNRRKRAWI